MNRDWPTLLGLGIASGLVQVCAGVAMYLAGVYFSPWSMGITALVLLLCIVVATQWYKTRRRGGRITYRQALLVGVVVSVSTGIVYAIYNVVSVSWFYPHFLDDMVRARMAQTGGGRSAESFDALRAQVSLMGIAVSNCIRLSVGGTVLSLLTSAFLRERGRETGGRA
jgi:hypothetical protein